MSANETRRFQPGTWRADGFLRLRGSGVRLSSRLCVWSRRSFVCVFVWSCITMHEESVLFAEPGRMEFGGLGTVHCSV